MAELSVSESKISSRPVKILLLTGALDQWPGRSRQGFGDAMLLGRVRRQTLQHLGIVDDLRSRSLLEMLLILPKY